MKLPLFGRFQRFHHLLAELATQGLRQAKSLFTRAGDRQPFDPAIVRIGRPYDPPFPLQPVQRLGHGARRNPQRLGNIGRSRRSGHPLDTHQHLGLGKRGTAGQHFPVEGFAQQRDDAKQIGDQLFLGGIHEVPQ